ncbi:DUF6250 domain-containing protein [Fodinibius salsisoli]|uniref:Rhamnogalacturonan acetylesterase n=1 Tax=Fodinibius salsisoli TaxID=2820877 RepID=A0ABT3PHB1_9BACT|nr:DUF6250 domain-containing protein [Fodinibius salsisoli]MCW9705301.1 rhamnogalacturonan acetylesterase [Fodinibius salsisoli]
MSYLKKFGVCSCSLLIIGILFVGSAHSQNANERDILLPKAANANVPSIYLVGDSTVRNGSGDGSNGKWGWGSFLGAYFDSTKVNVVNRALGGRSSRTYITQGYWDQQLELLDAGDAVIIQFGHNDASPVNDTSRARGVLDGIGSEKRDIFNKLTRQDETVRTYGSYLRTYISDIRSRGAIPVICSLVPTNGDVIDDEEQFATWAEQVATTEGVPFLDLNDIITQGYQEVGEAKKQKFFSDDRVHTTRTGAQFSAKMVVAALKGLQENPVSDWFSDKADKVTSRRNKAEEASRPVVTGYGEGLFEVGELMYQSDFDDPDVWGVQIEEANSPIQPRVDFWNGFLEVLVPGRGATIWNKKKFSGNVAITYKVKAPSTYVDELGIVVRDINVFWHASDPKIPDALFDQDKYTGAFTSYHKQQGYYASMGGRDNTTTRFRRYPRTQDGEPANHLALTSRDGQEEYLIKPNRTYTIQLVVFDDVIQYIVDGKVFYEIRNGDMVKITNTDGSIKEVRYTNERFLAYEEGWFGFRLVNTHHIYSDFRVYRLRPVE